MTKEEYTELIESFGYKAKIYSGGNADIIVGKIMIPRCYDNIRREELHNMLSEIKFYELDGTLDAWCEGYMLAAHFCLPFWKGEE